MLSEVNLSSSLTGDSEKSEVYSSLVVDKSTEEDENPKKMSLDSDEVSILSTGTELVSNPSNEDDEIPKVLS